MNLLFKRFCLFVFVCSPAGLMYAQEMRMNQTQIIGSHNSYKSGIEKPLMDMILADRPEAAALDYRHIPITEQLELGLRGLEIDVLFDPEGGRFAHPKGLEMLVAKGERPLPYNKEEMMSPGFKVLHVPDIDFRSHCATFKACLADIKEWSKQHNDHLPIIITINPKASGLERPGFVTVLPFDKAVLDAVDKEILEIFQVDELITPRQVKGKRKTLRNAVVDKGWPSLAKSKGKILFVLDAGKELTDIYVTNDDNYARLMFANVEASSPHAGFLIMNDPIEQEKEIAKLVSQGFMIRTRSDADTREARIGDKSRFEAAIRSGAQVITTDYYLKSLSPNGDFEITFGGKYGQCNPVLINSGCTLK